MKKEEDCLMWGGYRPNLGRMNARAVRYSARVDLMPISLASIFSSSSYPHFLTYLFFLLCYLVSCMTSTGLSAVADEPVKDAIVVQLQTIQPRQTPNVLRGDLLLGSVQAGQVAEFAFKIQNMSNEPLDLSRVKQSCACTDVKPPESTIQPGSLSEAGTLQIRIPQVRARNLVIAELTFVADDFSRPLAVVQVRADVERAFFVKSPPSSFVLDESPEFEAAIPIEIDPTVDPSRIEIKSGHPAITCRLTALESSTDSPGTAQPKEAEYVLVLKGQREAILASPSAIIQLVSKEHQIEDAFAFRFYNATLYRAIPPAAEQRGGLISFILYRQTGLEESAFEFIGMPGGIALEAELLQRSRNLMQVEINISDETPIEFIVIQALGEPVLEVPVYRKPQP